MTCPHCGDEGLEKGATGLDLCTKCGGLSRDGRALRRNHPFRVVQPQQIHMPDAVVVAGVVVAAVGLTDGSMGIAVSYVLNGDNQTLPPLVVAGELADNFARLVADAHKTTQRTRN